MNIEKSFFKQPLTPLTPEQRKSIKVVRLLMFVASTLMMPQFIYTIMEVQRGTPEIYPNQYLTGILLPVAIFFATLSFWFMGQAQLFPAKARRSLIIGLVSLAIFGLLSIISLWLALHRK